MNASDLSVDEQEIEMNSMKQRMVGAVLGVAGLAIASLGFVGCAAVQVQETGATPGSSLQAMSIQGIVHGGQQPVTGSVIQLYAAGMTGYGSAATPLILATVTSDQNGNFELPTYTCPSNSYVYVTATGGNPQVGGSSNADIGLMAALGSCATLKANAATTTVFIDEVTTVAAVWALQQFIGITSGTPLSSTPGSNPAFTVGTSSTNLQGLINAFGIANVLASTTTGSSPGANTSNTQTNVENFHVNTIANILASCINSDPSVSSNCGSLFTAATAGSTVPADTLQVAYSMAQNPGNNVQTLLALSSPTAPFQPSDDFANDWTIGFAVSAPGAYGTSYLVSPYWIAFDSYGNAWITNQGSSANSYSGFITELDPQGNPIGSKITSYNLGSSTATNLVTMGVETTPFELAIDPSNNVWVGDHAGGAVFRIAGSGSAAGANGGGGAAAYGVSTGTSSLPTAVAVDYNSTVWATLDGSTFSSTFGTASSQGLVGIVPALPTGGPLTGGFVAGKPGGSGTNDAYSLVVDATPASTYGAAPFVYAVNKGITCTSLPVGSINNFFAGAGKTVTGTGSNTTTTLGETTPANIIADSGEACSGASTSLSPVSVTYAGTMYNNVPAVYTPLGAAVDGLDDIWVLNTAAASTTTGYPAITLTKLVPSYSTNAATGALTSSYTPAVYTGGGLPTFATPQFLAIDGANNVWATTQAVSSPSPLSSFAEFNVNGTPLSPTTATAITSSRTAAGWFGGNTGTSTQRLSESRRGLAVDLSGNVWDVNNSSGGKEVFILVGAAVPVITPIASAMKSVSQGLGMKP